METVAAACAPIGTAPRRGGLFCTTQALFLQQTYRSSREAGLVLRPYSDSAGCQAAGRLTLCRLFYMQRAPAKKLYRLFQQKLRQLRSCIPRVRERSGYPAGAARPMRPRGVAAERPTPTERPQAATPGARPGKSVEWNTHQGRGQRFMSLLFLCRRSDREGEIKVVYLH